MGRYLVRRVLQAVPLLFIISLIVFALIEASSDPLSMYQNDPNMTLEDLRRLEARLGVDRPAHEQYVAWFGKTLSGDLGRSFLTSQPVASMILDRVPQSMLLMGVGMLIAIILALPLAIYSAVHQYSKVDNVITVLSLIGYATPNFWLGLMAIMFFSLQLRELGLPALPSGGMYSARVGPSVPEILYHLILPAAVIGVVQAAPYIRYLRSSLLEVLTQDYVRAARAKGLSENAVLYGHVLKNASLPLVTIILMHVPHMVGGAVVIEQVFAWPGMGRLFWEHAQAADYPVLMGILLSVAVFVLAVNIIADVMYAWLDPRIRYS